MDNARDKFHKLALNESFERVARVAKERAEFNRLMALSNGSNPMDNVPIKLWDCKIGTRENVSLPRGADFPMRMAVQKAFIELTGVDAEFCFSGWGNSLSEAELAVVENRLPDPESIAATRKHDPSPLVEALEVIAVGEGCMNGIREELPASALRNIARRALAEASQ